MKNFFVIFLIMIASVSFSQWKWQNPLPTSDNLHKIHFVNENTGYAAGFNGTVCKTINAGIDWEIISFDTNLAYAGGLYFIDDQRGIITNKDKVWKSINGGVNWTLIIISGSPVLGEVKFSDKSTGLISSDGGKVYRTTNGGAAWLPINTGYSIDLVTMSHASGGMFFAGTLDGKIIKTTNYGNTWTLQDLDTNANINNIDFINTNTGYAFCDYGVYFKTSNGGVNWILLNAPSLFSESRGVFINENTGFICGIRPYQSNNRGAIAKTINGGLNWTIDYFVNTYWLRDISKINNNVFTCGYWGRIYSSTDYGSTWPELSAGDPLFTIPEIKFVNPQRGIAVGYKGHIALTTNGGINWELRQLAAGPSNYFDVSFADENNVLVTGWYGLMFRSSNGGETWTGVTSITAMNFTDLDFVNSNTAFASTYNDRLKKSTNGGVNWFTLNSSPVLIACIDFINENTGFISAPVPGRGNGIYKTTDGGISFNIKTDSIFSLVSQIHCLDENTIWFSAHSSKIYKSTDGGENWINTLNIGGFDVNDIDFVDINTGYATGYYLYNGRILYTTNSGLNWNLQFEKYNGGSSTIEFINAGTGFMGGSLGVILRTTNGGGTVGITYIGGEVPTDFMLYQNYPNPFNPSTNIKFNIPKASQVKLAIYDILGRKVELLVSEKLNAGSYEYSWNALHLSSGIYFYRLETETFRETKRMILLK